MKLKIKQLVAPAALSMMALGTGQALAYEAGDWVVRGGYASVNPDSTSDSVYPGSPIDGSKVEADDGEAAGISLTYMVSSNIGIEILAATPFTHDIKAKGTLATVTKDVGETKHLPPTVSVQYFQPVADNVNVYCGLGINYTTFFSEDTSELTEALGSDTDLKLKDSYGLAVSAGADFQIDDQWGINAGVYWIDIDSEARLNTALGTDRFDVEIDPMVYRLNVVYKL